MKFHGVFALFLAVILSFPAYAQDQEGQPLLYIRGVEKYKNKENDEALRLFESFRKEDPFSIKADDALWYIGRLYMRMDNTAEAEKIFRELLEINDTNRKEEASYDLARILIKDKRYTELVKLLEGLTEKENPDKYEIKSLELLGRSYYVLALRAKSEYMDKEAGELFLDSAEVYRILESEYSDAGDRSDALYRLGRIYRHLFYLAGTPSLQREYYEKSLKFLTESGIAEAEPLIEEITRTENMNFLFNADLLGGLENITGEPGMDLSVSADAVIPLAFRTKLKGGLEYNHNPFSFKTYNFDALKTGDTRLIQTTDKVSAYIDLYTGSIRSFRNAAGITGRWRFAEDFGDDYYEVELSDDGRIRLDEKWKTGWDSSFKWKVFPDYLVGGHKIDSVQGEVSPFVHRKFTDRLGVSAAYGFKLKQYLDAKYDTSDINTAATEDRQYVENSIEVDLKSKFGRKIETGLSYEFLVLESNNYDVWITDKNSTTRFIADYYDYVQHTVTGNTDIQLSERAVLGFEASVEVRQFTNYIARDSSGVFLPGDEKRRDLSYSVSGEAEYTVFSGKNGVDTDIIIRAWLDKAVSTMEYESSFDTNYVFYGFLAGVRIRYR